MSDLGVFIGLLTFFSAGLGVAMLIRRGRGPISVIELIPLSWLLGTAFISGAQALLNLVCTGILTQGIVTVLSVALGLSALASLKKAPGAIKWPRPSGALQWLLCLLLLSEFVAVFWIAHTRAFNWDGLLVWEIKARYIFLNGGSCPVAYFTDPTRLWSHPEYPLYLPFTEAWLYFWIGDCDQTRVRIIGPIFCVVAALLVYTGVSRLSGRKILGLLGAALFFFIPWLLFGTWNALIGYADFPLAVFYLAAMLYLLFDLRQPAASDMLCAAIFAGTLPWIKMEGAVLWLLLSAIAAAHFFYRRRPSRALLIALPGLLCLLIWKLACTLLQAKVGGDFLPFSLTTFQQNTDRLPLIFQRTLAELLHLNHWSLLWPGTLVAVICLFLRGSKSLAITCLCAILAPLAIYASLYVFSDWAPSYLLHIEVSFPRLVFQIAPFAFLVIFLAIGAARKKSPPAS